MVCDCELTEAAVWGLVRLSG